MDEFDTVIAFMEKHQFKSFCFSYEHYSSQFELQVKQSLDSDATQRQNRLASSHKTPSKMETIVTVFKRNPDVVAEVLIRAKGKCESCGKPAPFKRRKDDKPYLEVHHKVFLSNGGDDTVENAEALCPNCHKEKHFG
ncbi:HNH endonuclease [Methylotuvimicrobium alcaliphilum]|uniref:HNH nuclease n=1 Tax=Methylotuvimicrobium alcaliphilum (strain DSM 19304 / NCIMB 14124 / VKM B-2133 / 20Z) TaxID=1091494 RepID=G4T266_META2